MKKAFSVILALLLISSLGWAQVKVYDNGDLFDASVCSLGGIASKFGSPGATRDTSYIISSTMSFLVTAPGGVKYMAKRAWLELAVTDTNAATGALAGKNDSLVALLYGMGPGAKESDAALDTLLFVFSTVKGKSEVCEITPLMKTFLNTELASERTLDRSALGLGDSLFVELGRAFPLEGRFYIFGDCSTATYGKFYNGKYNDTLMVKVRLILDAGVPDQLGW